MKATSIRVNVLRFSTNGEPWDCTNGGATATADAVVLLAPGAPVPEGCRIHVLRVVPRPHFGDVIAEPVERPRGMVGPMCGGNFVYTSDSRYSEVTGVRYPLAVHDRFESVELARSMD